MASATGIRVEGLSRVVRDLQKFGVEVEDLKDAMARLAEQVKPDYQRFTPVGTAPSSKAPGRLRGDFRTGKAKGKAVLYVGRASIPYAGPINYGWPARNIRPANFIAKGDQIAAPKAHASLEDAISDLITNLNLG